MSTTTSAVPSVLSHYRLEAKIGSGGMGEVYRAHDEHLGRDVAIKILARGALIDDAARRRFRNEALLLSRLSHPNIATIHDFDTQDGIDFLVTEYVPGVTLAEKLVSGPLPEHDLLDLATQLAEGLAAAHAEGIAHRDLKPGNLRILPEGRLKILDFGLAQSVAPMSAETPTTSAEEVLGVAGTLAFMAPEQLRGETPDLRSDIYAVGVVLYEMATAQLPFSDPAAAALVDAILNRPPLPPARLRPNLSPRLHDIILKCLEKTSERRYQSCRELLVDLRRASAHVDAGRTLAVLYFDNLSQQKEDEYFRDGITEDITTELCKIRDLKVLSRSAMLAYRDKPVTPTRVAQELNTTHVLEGSVRREGSRVRINAKLVEAATGHALWAERYDRELRDIFAIQDEIAQAIAHALRLVLSEGELRAIGKVPTADVQAYDFYLRGRHFFHQFRRKGFDLAREMFARAIELDPNYARAYAGIADCCGFVYLYWESSAPHLEEADKASTRALELDPDLAEAHASRGFTASLKKNYKEARAEFETAMRLNPALFEAYYFYARSYYAQGELDRAVHWFTEAARVNPEDYQSPMLLASALHGLGRNEAAAAAYRRGLAAAERHLMLYPGDARALYFGANALSQLNDRERSLQWASRALTMEPDEPQVLYNVACIYALLEEPEKAVDCLERSLTGSWGQLEWMAHDPDLASLHNHPRFQRLLATSKSE